jgi:two-component system chemotaxis response regulator CheB
MQEFPAAFHKLDLKRYEIVVVGGSAGSFPVVNTLLEHISPRFRFPIVFALHRLRDKREGFSEALEYKSKIPVREPEDKEPILKGTAYIAPSNYHLLVETDGRFALSITDLVQFSRPSIDVLFESVADVYGPNALAIILSGANRDGAEGMRRLKRKGATTVIQNPATAVMPTMPTSVTELIEVDYTLEVDEIVRLLDYLNQ